MPIVAGAIPVVVAVGGWLTNLLTAGWNWWLFGVLGVVVTLASVLTIVAETALRQPAFADTPGSRPPAAPVWLDVPPRSHHFTGREDLLTRLERQPEDGTGLTALVPHALYGLGGVGKTHLAIEYAHRNRDRFDLVAWIPAEQPAPLRSSYLRLAAAMGIAGSDDVERTMDLVRDGLRRGDPFRRWLIILDNAGDPASRLPYLPQPAHADSVSRVLITSRDRTWSRIAQTMEVDVLHRRESVALLRKRNPEVSDEDAARLAEQLGDLPLSLEQASAWIEASGTSVPEYLRLLSARAHDLLRINHPADYPMSVAAAWGVALDRLSAIDAAATQLLELCAFLAPEPIARELLRFGRQVELPTALRYALGDPVRFGQAMSEIGRLSLAKLDSARGTIQLHRLVQMVLRSRLSPEDQVMLRSAAQALLAAADSSVADVEESSSWPRHAMLTPHLRPAGCLDSTAGRVRELVVRQASYLFVRGDNESCRELSQEAWTKWKEQLGPDHEQTLRISIPLANAARYLGDHVLSRKLMEETLQIARRTLGDLHPVTLRAANGYGGDLRVSGEYQRAYELDLVTLNQHRETFGAVHGNTVRTSSNLAVDLRNLGRFSDALALDEENVRVHRQLHGDNHWSLLYSRCTVAADLYHLGRYEQALDILSSAIPQLAALLGPSHTNVLWPTRLQAIVLSAFGRTADATALSRETLKRYETTRGEKHHATIAMAMTVANLLSLTDPRTALRLARGALELHHQVHGDEHPATIAALINTAIIERRRGQHSEAERHDRQAVEASRTVLGTDHWVTLCAQLGMASDQALAGDRREACALSSDTYARSLAARGEDDPYTLACAVNLVHDLHGAGNAPAAAKLQSRLATHLADDRAGHRLLLRTLRDGRRIEYQVELPAP